MSRWDAPIGAEPYGDPLERALQDLLNVELDGGEDIFNPRASGYFYLVRGMPTVGIPNLSISLDESTGRICEIQNMVTISIAGADQKVSLKDAEGIAMSEVLKEHPGNKERHTNNAELCYARVSETLPIRVRRAWLVWVGTYSGGYEFWIDAETGVVIKPHRSGPHASK